MFSLFCAARLHLSGCLRELPKISLSSQVESPSEGFDVPVSVPLGEFYVLALNSLELRLWRPQR